MNFKSNRIAALSRDHGFQFKTVVIILLAGMAVAFGISLFRAKAIEKYLEKGAKWAWVRDFIASRPITSRRDCVRLLEEIRLNGKWNADFVKRDDPKKEMPPTIPGAERLADAHPFLRKEEEDVFSEFSGILIVGAQPDKEDL